MSIHFRFHPHKAVAAAAMFLKMHGKPMKYLGLLKMLYMADRLALKRMEQPITGDRYVSMDFGPVLSGVYDLIKGKPVDDALPFWSESISTRDANHTVYLLNDPGDEELCEAEEEIIREVYQTCGHYDRFALADLTHDFPEWQDPHGTSVPISPEDILRNVGKSDEEIEEIQQESWREAYLDGVLSV